MSMTDQASRVTAPAPRRRGPASTEDGRRSRDRILKAALDLIIEVGIDQVRLAEIARRAGMSSGQVMYYFTSKEHILLETLAWQDHLDLLRTRAALEKVTDAWRQLDGYIYNYLPAGPSDPGWILWMEAWARAPHNRQVTEFMEKLLAPWRDDLAAIIARGVAEGAFAAPASLDDFTLRFNALLDGLALLTSEGYVAGAPALKVALRAFRDGPLSEEDELRWLWLACRIARALADDGAWDELTARHLELARRAGAFSALPIALTDRVLVELFSGRIGVAMSLAAESDAVVEATGSHLTLRTSIVLANWRGRDDEALALIEARREDVLRRGEGLWLAANDWGSAIRHNGLGRYEDALAAAERAVGAARGLGPSILLLAELTEAAARSGQAERATGPLAQLAEIAQAAGTDWALGTHARAAAMLAEGDAAERLYREAVERLSHVKTCATLARAHLLYGEWLRREHRRVDAREQLRVAYTMLSDMGMEAFAERAAANCWPRARRCASAPSRRAMS